MDDIFTKIIRREIPAEIVYEDEHTLAFLDISPANHGHTLVIPKEHYRNILDIPEDVLLRVMKTVRMLAPIIKQAVGADGINVAMNSEASAHQSVFHAHVHIIPRFEGDPHQPWVGTPYKEGEAHEVAEKIQKLLKK